MAYKRELTKEIKETSYNPDKKEKNISEHVDKRIMEMKNYRSSLKIEKEWQSVDQEYIPTEIEFNNLKRIGFETDQLTGLRSHMVPIGDASKSWRSNASAPILLTKIQTALAIIVDNDPKGLLVPMKKKYEATTALAESLWKRNWSITDAKQKYKLFVFNMFKYGWAPIRVHPQIIKYNKSVLTEVDTENPDKNVYEDKEIVWFNDVNRTVLDPYRTWIDEQTRPYDNYSMNDCYYEIDYSYEQARVEFGKYKNFDSVSPNSRVVDEKDTSDTARKDIVTIGFYQNRLLDMYVIYVPKSKIVLYSSPLPNDDGLIDLVHAPLMLRDASSPYGVSVWQIIKQDKQLYDKMNNMTMDQLVLSIMKFGFHTGTNAKIGDGHIAIEPGVSHNLINGEFKWMEIPGPGEDSWRGLSHIREAMDDSSGITPTLQGETTAGTLGQSQIEQETSLKRLKTPIENISYAIENDAYLTLSWTSQILSTPELKEFADENERLDYEEENGVSSQENIQPETDDYGDPLGKIQSLYYPEIALHLEDSDGQLTESKESRFFQIGSDIDPNQLKWKGIFRVVPKSLIGTSETIIRMTKLEMTDRLLPLMQMPPELAMKIAIQIVKVHEEDPEDWIPDVWLNPPPVDPMQQMMEQMGGEGGEEEMQEEGQEEEQPLFTPTGQEEEQPLFVPSQGEQEQPLFVPTQ